ncbi:MAG TPA: hypothetical protein VFU94_09385 [Conexibacter sp.]|nr:hypothetical protein [Conexibacter sp.]
MLELDPRLRLPLRDERLTALVYELLDAHDDTARLAREGGAARGPLVGDLRWDAHLAYLRDLQRVARELLAQGVAA